MLANDKKDTSHAWNEALEARSDVLGVSQQIKSTTKTAALSYAVKHDLSMAETFEKAIALLIEADSTPEPEKFDMSKIPDDVNGISEVTLKFTHSEMKAMRRRFGVLDLDGKMEAFFVTAN